MGKIGFFVRRRGEALGALDVPCADVTAIALSADSRAIGTASTRILRGDYAVSGTVRRATTSGPQPIDGAHVEIRVSDFNVDAITDADGRFTVNGLPEATVWTVSARRSIGGVLLAASTTPRAALGAALTKLDVTLDLTTAPAVGDDFEPDNSIADVAGKPVASIGAGQSHVSASYADVEVIPFTAKTGTPYTLRVRSTGPVTGDFALAFIDSAGTVKAQANIDPADYSATPSVRWIADATGKVYARISRNDREARSVAYEMVITNE